MDHEVEAHGAKDERGDRPGDFACEECGKRFERKVGLLGHIGGAHRRTEKPGPKAAPKPEVQEVVCLVAECDYWNRSKEAVGRHVASEHPKCAGCLNRFVDLATLRAHYQAEHRVGTVTEALAWCVGFIHGDRDDVPVWVELALEQALNGGSTT
jgi:hypothetical protein